MDFSNRDDRESTGTPTKPAASKARYFLIGTIAVVVVVVAAVAVFFTNQQQELKSNLTDAVSQVVSEQYEGATSAFASNKLVGKSPYHVDEISIESFQQDGSTMTGTCTAAIANDYFDSEATFSFTATVEGTDIADCAITEESATTTPLKGVDNDPDHGVNADTPAELDDDETCTVSVDKDDGTGTWYQTSSTKTNLTYSFDGVQWTLSGSEDEAAEQTYNERAIVGTYNPDGIDGDTNTWDYIYNQQCGEPGDGYFIPDEDEPHYSYLRISDYQDNGDITVSFGFLFNGVTYPGNYIADDAGMAVGEVDTTIQTYGEYVGFPVKCIADCTNGNSAVVNLAVIFDPDVEGGLRFARAEEYDSDDVRTSPFKVFVREPTSDTSGYYRSPAVCVVRPICDSDSDTIDEIVSENEGISELPVMQKMSDSSSAADDAE